MAASDWRLEGEWMKNCNCAFGCPCDFNALPTHGYCKGMVGMRITTGHFEGVKLDGLCFAVVVDFPGALHQGNGKMQPIVDQRATLEQRQALFNILSGKHSAEGTLFHIFSLIVTTIHDPIFAPFEFSFDKDGRVAKLVAGDVLRDRGGADQESRDRCSTSNSSGHARGLRAQGCRDRVRQHPLGRCDTIRDPGHAQFARQRRADARGRRGVMQR